MSDQADGLRELVRARSGATALADRPEPRREREAPSKAWSLLFTSGKGGVGTSNLALNLAIALAEAGERVVLIDADLGLANIDLLCGLTPAHDLGDVLSGACRLSDAVVEGPGGVRILPGAHGMRTLLEALGDGPARLVDELSELEEQSDFVIIDAGSGLGPGIATLATAADEVVVVTTPEPTSVADAHAAIHRFRRTLGPPRLRALVNQAATASEAADVLARLSASSRQFLGTVVTGLGYVRVDPHVRLAVRARRPFVVGYPGSAASREVRRLARVLVAERRPRGQRPGFFAALGARWALGRVAR
jgi:flagellar biosynthesis protein FlhG